MGKNYDNWERLVTSVLQREKLRQLAYCNSLSSTSSSFNYGSSSTRIEPLQKLLLIKSGYLLISSKALGLKSWKKRWFILTRMSLVFFKSDPAVGPQRGGEVNLTLGGIDLDNSGSVVFRDDKKLLTVLLHGQAYTVKAETSEDLYEWKTAIEYVLAQAPSAALVRGRAGIPS